MIRKLLPCIALVLSLLALFACERSRSPAEPPGGDTELSRPGLDPAPAKSFVPSEDHLQLVLDQGDSYTYEVAFSGTVNIAAGGVLEGHPATWPERYGFAMVIPAGAIVPPEPGMEEVTITCSVPVASTTFASPDEDMPLIFEPDGLQFSQPATVILCYHPNLEPSCDGYVFYSVDVDASGSLYAAEIVSTTVAAQSVAKTLAPPPRVEDPIDPLIGDCHLSIMASMSHFSRWEITKGNGDGP